MIRDRGGAQDDNKKSNHNREKTKVEYISKVKYLGYSFYKHKEFRFRVHPKSIDKMKRKLKELTARRNGWSNDYRILRLKQFIRGLVNYFGKFNPSAMKYTLMCIERRIIKWAMCKYKNFRGHRRRAEKWLASVRKREPKMFAHWSKIYSYC